MTDFLEERNKLIIHLNWHFYKSFSSFLKSKTHNELQIHSTKTKCKEEN